MPTITQDLKLQSDPSTIVHPNIESANIPSSAITEDKIATGAVTGTKMASNTIQSGNIQDSAITQGKIRSDAVSTAKIQDGAVTEQKIANAAISTAKIQDGAISTAKIQDSSITQAKIQNEAVSTAKIQDEAVTLDKLNLATIGLDEVDFGSTLADAISVMIQHVVIFGDRLVLDNQDGGDTQLVCYGFKWDSAKTFFSFKANLDGVTLDQYLDSIYDSQDDVFIINSSTLTDFKDNFSSGARFYTFSE